VAGKVTGALAGIEDQVVAAALERPTVGVPVENEALLGTPRRGNVARVVDDQNLVLLPTQGERRIREGAAEAPAGRMEDANNQAISADEREKRKKAAEGKLIEVKEMEQSITQFDRQAMATLEEQEQRMRTKLLEEIQIVIDNKAKAGNFTLVLDKAGETRNRTPFVLFFNGQDDITALILKDLNANAPAGYLPTDSSKDK